MSSMHRRIFTFSISALAAMLCGCTVGPDYQRPSIPVPQSYKEIHTADWQKAQPADLFPKGQWWLVFNDPALNSLESQLNISNQNIKAAAAQYQQALALVQEARAAYFPSLSVNASSMQQVTGSAPNSGPIGSGNSDSSNVNQISLAASWEADLWGNVRRNVEANVAGAQISQAQLAAARLSAQASLAQFYFQLRGVDSDHQLLAATVKSDQKILTLTKEEFKNGTASMEDIVQARSQLENAQSLLINLGINRGQYEHAIAVLIGKAPADLSLPYHPFFGAPPVIPATLPSALLERRPDIAAAERGMAQANAQIGVAIAAYYPTLTLSPEASMQSINNFFRSPFYSWSVGPLLAQTLLDGGLRSATTAAARANYNATVAQYRQTVLAAFQNVEDNLVSVRVLKSQGVVQNKAAKDAEIALQLTLNQYQFGTASYINVLTSQVAAYNAEKSAVDITTLRMVSTVELINALGGGFVAPNA